MRPCFVVLYLVLVSLVSSSATTIRVPQDQPTVQAGIDAANNGDTVLVSPNAYGENIDFHGKAITVTSTNGAKATSINGGGANSGAVVNFSSSEPSTAVLSGFTIQNGGVGINISFASPTIRDNVIRGNSFGGGISIYMSSPTILRNRILDNTGAIGGGINITGDSRSQVLNNMFQNNFASEFGGGLVLFAAGHVLVANNVFSNNSTATQGGAIYMVNEADEIIFQNLFVTNSAPSGAEIYSLVPQSLTGYRFVNNTIISNNSASDAAFVADGFNSNAMIINNLIITSSSETALLCNPIYNEGPPIVAFNDAFSATGISYGNTCAGFVGKSGNISANPQFVNPRKGDFEVAAGSRAIDSGHNFAQLPKTDLAGNPRIVGPSVDMGAYEYQGNEHK